MTTIRHNLVAHGIAPNNSVRVEIRSKGDRLAETPKYAIFLVETSTHQPDGSEVRLTNWLGTKHLKKLEILTRKLAVQVTRVNNILEGWT